MFALHPITLITVPKFRMKEDLLRQEQIYEREDGKQCSSESLIIHLRKSILDQCAEFLKKNNGSMTLVCDSNTSVLNKCVYLISQVKSYFNIFISCTKGKQVAV